MKTYEVYFATGENFRDRERVRAARYEVINDVYYFYGEVPEGSFSLSGEILFSAPIRNVLFVKYQ